MLNPEQNPDTEELDAQIAALERAIKTYRSFRRWFLALGIFSFLFLTIPFMAIVWNKKLKAARREVRLALDHLDIRLINLLVDLLPLDCLNYYALNHRQSHYDIVEALAKLLPLLQEGDGSHLTPDRRARLLRALANVKDRHKSSYPLGFRVAILKAFGEVGDATAIPAVHHLAEMKDSTYERRSLRDAARECLPLLLARVEKAEEPNRLLRPSEGENAALLRPAQAGTESDTEILLRPMTDKEGGR
jgi:hypothetical protein